MDPTWQKKLAQISNTWCSQTHTLSHTNTHRGSAHTALSYLSPSTWPRILPIACSTHQLTGGGVRTRGAAPRLVAAGGADAALNAAVRAGGVRRAGRAAVLWRHAAAHAAAAGGRYGAQGEAGPGAAALRVQLEQELKNTGVGRFADR
jgi:hypothetical protein